MAKAAPLTLYGIKNCDTMKKARTWLEGQGLSYAFHDYREVGLDKATLEQWIGRVGWEVLLNRNSTTFRDLPEAERAGVTEGKAIGLMLAQPTMIKRPVLDLGDRLLVGFKPDAYAKAFG